MSGKGGFGNLNGLANKGLSTHNKGLETATAPPPKTRTADKPGHGTGRKA